MYAAGKAGPPEDPRPALIRALPGSMSEARNRLARNPGDEAGLHRLRVSLKRMRSLWRLSRPLHAGNEPDRERQSLGKSAQKLSAARNRHVILGLLAELLEAGKPDSPAGPNLRPETQGAATGALGILEVSLLKFLSFPLLQEGEGPWGKSLIQAYRRARNRMPASADEEDEAFHRWRKAVKDLLYALESWPGKSRKRRSRWIGKLDLLQDRLGKTHDFSVLESILTGSASKRRSNAPLSRREIPQGKARKQALLRAAREKRNWKRKGLAFGRKLFEPPPRKFRHRLL